MRLRFGMAWILAAGLAARAADGQTKAAPAAGPRLSPEKIAEGIWASPTPGGANVGWFTVGDFVVAVDSGTDDAVGRAIVAEIQKTTGKRPRYVLVTHAHKDHAGGVGAFAAAGAQVVVAEKSAPGVLSVLESAAASAAGKKPAPPIVMTISERLLLVGAPGRRVEIYYLGPAHTQGDLIVALPSDGILFSGDIVVTGVLPYLRSGDVDPKNWERILGILAGLKIEKLVPGHGAIGPVRGLQDTAAYIARVNEIAERLVLSNTPDALIEARLAMAENTIENVKLTPEHVANVKAVYDLARAQRAKPTPAPPTPTPVP